MPRRVVLLQHVHTRTRRRKATKHHHDRQHRHRRFLVEDFVTHAALLYCCHCGKHLHLFRPRWELKDATPRREPGSHPVLNMYRIYQCRNNIREVFAILRSFFVEFAGVLHFRYRVRGVICRTTGPQGRNENGAHGNHASLNNRSRRSERSLFPTDYGRRTYQHTREVLFGDRETGTVRKQRG